MGIVVVLRSVVVGNLEPFAESICSSRGIALPLHIDQEETLNQVRKYFHDIVTDIWSRQSQHKHFSVL